MKNYLQQPIIFIGVGRSGTTIISEIIFQHAELAWISNYQEKFPASVEINRIRPLLDNNLWHLTGQKQQLNRTTFYNKYAFRPSEAYRFWEQITGPEINFSREFLLGKKVSDEQKVYMRSFFSKMVAYQKRKRLAFKITGPGRVRYLSSIFPDAVFVEVTREPFANIRSLLKVPFWQTRGKHQLWWKGAYNEKEEEQAKYWRSRPALITALQYKKIRETTTDEINETRVKHYQVAYEDFVKRPDEEMEKILKFVGLKRDKFMDDYMNKNKIYDRNIDARVFFSKAEQDGIDSILK